jgi:putative peptidoglycan binding protein/glycosyl hydrolase family 46
MAERILFGLGAIGEIVKQIQITLTSAGFDTQGTDGWFGKNTMTALSNFQQSKQLPPTGVVDESSWRQLMQRPLPSVGDRSLGLTAAFEGHGYGLAMGNFDGALLTWGVIGFTMASGEVQQIVNAVNQNDPHLVRDAFQDSAEELLTLVNSPIDSQTAWADKHTLANGALVQPWREMFATFGAFPEVQAEQMRHVISDYLSPAIKTAANLNLTSELGLALCFDIHVQNGGIKRKAMAQIRQSAPAATPEPTLLEIVANAVADSARIAYQDDVRQRKLTIAQGQGTVHGHNYVLENWGLSGSFSAGELARSAKAGD